MMQRLLGRLGSSPNPQTTESPIHSPNPFDLPIRDSPEYTSQMQPHDGIGEQAMPSRYTPLGLTLPEPSEPMEPARSPRSTTSFELLGSQDYEDSRPASPMSIISMREVTDHMDGQNPSVPCRVSGSGELMSSARTSPHSSHRSSYEDTVAADLILGETLVSPNTGVGQGTTLGDEAWGSVPEGDDDMEGDVEPDFGTPTFEPPSAAAGIVAGVLGRPALVMTELHVGFAMQPAAPIISHPSTPEHTSAVTTSAVLHNEESVVKCDADFDAKSETSEGWEVDMQATREELNAAGAEAEARAARPRSRLMRARSTPQMRGRGGLKLEGGDSSGSEGGELAALQSERDELACKLLETDAALAAEQAKLRSAAAEAAAQRALVMQLLAAQAPDSDDETSTNEGAGRTAATDNDAPSRPATELVDDPLGAFNVLSQLLAVVAALCHSLYQSLARVIGLRVAGTTEEQQAWPRRLQQLRASRAAHPPSPVLWTIKATMLLLLALLLRAFIVHHARGPARQQGSKHITQAHYPASSSQLTAQQWGLYMGQAVMQEEHSNPSQDPQLRGRQASCRQTQTELSLPNLQPTVKALAARHRVANQGPADAPAAPDLVLQSQVGATPPAIPLPSASRQTTTSAPPSASMPHPPGSQPAGLQLGAGVPKRQSKTADRSQADLKLQLAEWQKQPVVIVPAFSTDVNATAISDALLRKHVEVHAVVSGCAARCSDAQCTSRCTAARRDLQPAEPALARDPPILPSKRLAAQQESTSSSSFSVASSNKQNSSIATPSADHATSGLVIISAAVQASEPSVPTLPQLPPVSQTGRIQQQEQCKQQSSQATCSVNQPRNAFKQGWEAVPLALAPRCSGLTYDQYVELQETNGRRRAWLTSLESASSAATAEAAGAAATASLSFTALPALGAASTGTAALPTACHGGLVKDPSGSFLHGVWATLKAPQNRMLPAAAPQAALPAAHQLVPKQLPKLPPLKSHHFLLKAMLKASEASWLQRAGQPAFDSQLVAAGSWAAPIQRLRRVWTDRVAASGSCRLVGLNSTACRSPYTRITNSSFTALGMAARLIRFRSMHASLTAQGVQTVSTQSLSCCKVCSSNVTAQGSKVDQVHHSTKPSNPSIIQGESAYTRALYSNVSSHGLASKLPGFGALANINFHNLAAKLFKLHRSKVQYSNSSMQGLTATTVGVTVAPAIQHAAESGLESRVATLAAQATSAAQFRAFKPGSFGARLLQQLASPEAIAAKHATAVAVKHAKAVAVKHAKALTALNVAPGRTWLALNPAATKADQATATLAEYQIRPANKYSNTTCISSRRAAQPVHKSASAWPFQQPISCFNIQTSQSERESLHKRHMRLPVNGSWPRMRNLTAALKVWLASKRLALPSAAVLAALPAAPQRAALPPAAGKQQPARHSDAPTSQAVSALHSNGSSIQQESTQQQSTQPLPAPARKEAKKGTKKLGLKEHGQRLRGVSKSLQRLVKKLCKVADRAESRGQCVVPCLSRRQRRQLKWAAADTRTASKQMHAAIKQVLKCQKWQARAAEKLLQVLDEGATLGVVARSCHPVKPGPNATWVEAGPEASRAAAWKHTQLQLQCVMRTASFILRKHNAGGLDKPIQAAMLPWSQQLLQYQDIASGTVSRCEKVSEHAWSAGSKLDTVLTHLLRAMPQRSNDLVGASVSGHVTTHGKCDENAQAESCSRTDLRQQIVNRISRHVVAMQLSRKRIEQLVW